MNDDIMEDYIEDKGSLHIGKVDSAHQFNSAPIEHVHQPSNPPTDILFPTAYQRVQRPHKFFRPGRVFQTVWIEPAGPSPRNSPDHITPVSYGQHAFTKPSRFISLRNQKGFCVALRIHTYGGRGESKYSTRPAHLFHIHSANDEAASLEPGVSINIEDPDITFATGKAVVLASKPYSVEHFLPVRNIGYVEKTSLALLEAALLESFVKEPLQSKTPTKSAAACMKKGIAESRRDTTETLQHGQLVDDSSSRHVGRHVGEASQSTEVADNEPGEHERNSQAALLDGSEVTQRSYSCDYDLCPRREQSFYKIEHLRDHLRDYHLEDILRNRKFGNEMKRVEWLAARRVDVEWWRCKNCLARVCNSADGWECPTCRRPCELERVENRVQRYPGPYDGQVFSQSSVGTGVVESDEGG